MDDSEAEKAAILAMLRAETEAWMQRDFDALARHWVQSPQSRRMYAFAALGVWTVEGWDAIAARIRNMMARSPERHAFEGRVRFDRVNVVVAGEMAWVSYDQIGVNDARDVQRVLKIVQRTGGAWKIGCTVLMQGAVEQASCPLVEVDAEARVLWMNPQAQERLPGYGGLVVAAGRLRAQRRERGAALRAALDRAFEVLHSQRPLTVVAEQAWAVPLGEGEAGVPLYCWVLVEDGRALVSFDDAETVARRITRAAEVYRLSPAQVRLARAIVDGQDLAAASGSLGVSVNTLRTQLQRVFDKTGVRSQAALVRVVLGAEIPTR